MRKPYFLQSSNSSYAFKDIASVTLNELENFNSVDVAYWLIDMRIWDDGWEILCKIRRNLSPTIYLKPVVFMVDSGTMPHEFKSASDGNIDSSNCNSIILEELVSTIEPINQWIDDLPDLNTSKDNNLAFKVLRLIASRNMELEPVTTIKRHSGYIYPLLEPMFGKRDSGVIQTLSFLESQRLLSTNFVTRAHFCGHCGSAFLNFKETCAHCQQDDIHSDEIIHHFKCAYTGEMSDFKQDDRLVCPKCESQLKHIGVDYDKPSIIYHCNECSHTFQDPKIITRCFNCDREAAPENQEIKSIHAYGVSSIGQNAAEFGLDALFTNILNTELNLFSEQEFHNFLDVEVSRIKRYKLTTSSLAIIHFHDLDKLYIRLGNRAREVFKELSLIFKTVLRESDIITAKNETIFFVLMTETSTEHAERAVERLQDGIRELFKNNLDFHPKISFKINNVSKELDIDLSLEEFLKE